MSADLEFTGERYVPGTAGEIAHEHWHRYAFARRFVAARRVADVACGEGYGSALLAESAASVAGVDIDATTLAHARSAYAACANVRFLDGSATGLPLHDASVDVVVSFETIEHLDAGDQPKMLAEFARVLAPDGIVIVSSPNRPEYSDAREYANPVHRHELDRDELQALLAPHFPALSLFTDRDGRELARVDREAREVLRLDGILRTRDEQLKEQMHHARELQAMVEYRDHRVAELELAQRVLRDEVAEVMADRDRVVAQVAAQERIITYREGFRWWLTLPWLIARRAWNRIRNA